MVNFNPRPPYGERPASTPKAVIAPLEFQSTPPVRGATYLPSLLDLPVKFQSTPPVRGATPLLRKNGIRYIISIHAPRTGSDGEPVWCEDFGCWDFNPRPPYGERPAGGSSPTRTPAYFNPRPPYGERRATPDVCGRRSDFNPRPPYGERPTPLPGACQARNFNPRPPYGERPAARWSLPAGRRISIHAPRTGSDVGR